VGRIRKGSRLPQFFMCPKYLSGYKYNGTTIITFMLLYERARQSMTSDKWTDENGDTFILYTEEELAKALGRTERCIRMSLDQLEKDGHIQRTRTIPDASHIYVCIPEEKFPYNGTNIPVVPEQTFPYTGTNIPLEPEQTFPLNRNECSADTGTNVPPSNNNIVINTSNNKSNIRKTAYGYFKNVFLTDEEYSRLSTAFPNLDKIIEKMSSYLSASGKTYHNYEAAIRSWAANEPQSYQNLRYERNEKESL